MIEYESHFQFIADSNVVPVVIISYSHGPTAYLNALYDAGVREGDKVVLAVDWLDPSIYEIATEEDRPHVEEMLYGCFSLFPENWSGDIGQHVLQQMQLRTPYTSMYMCFFYDVMLEVAYNFEALLNAGKEYERPTVFMKGWKTIRFSGCSGLIRNESGTNNRVPSSYVVSQV
jgi:hypothetical protein